MIRLVILGLFSLTLLLSAQTPGDYFHNGAQYYVGSQLEQAIAAVERGLQIEPDNSRLQALLQKLKEQQQQQQQQNQDQNQEQQKQDSQQQQQNQDQEQDQKQEQQEQDQQEQQKDQEKENEQEQQEQEQQEPQNVPDPKEISKADAERILQAMSAKEKENQKLRQQRVKGKKKVEKDW